jgi:hypothetical protein
MTVQAGDIMRAAVNWVMPEQVDAYNVLGLVCYQGTCSDSDFLTSCATWMTSAYSALQGVIHNQVDIATARITQVTWSGTEWIVTRVIGTIFPTFAATDANDMLPHAVAGVVTFPTAIPTRRGRIFVPGLSEVQQADSLLVAGAATALGNFAGLIRTAFHPTGGDVSYYVLGKGGTASVSTGFQVNGLTGTQRKRKPGIGI